MKRVVWLIIFYKRVPSTQRERLTKILFSKIFLYQNCLLLCLIIPLADFVNGLVLLVSLKIHFNSSEEQTSYAVSDGIGKVQSSKPLISLSSQKQNYCCIMYIHVIRTICMTVS